MLKMGKANELGEEIEEVFEEQNNLIQRPELEADPDKKCEECIFGYDIFQFSPTSFSSVENMPVPETYMVGPGDEILIEYFGIEDNKEKTFISRDGLLSLPEIGPLNVTGLTFIEMKELIKEKVSRELAGVFVSVSIIKLRSIKVYILGEAYKPGAYTISALSSVSNALFVSGGVNEQGSLRNIQVKRGGKLISTYDFYDLLIKGNTKTEVVLQDGDVIYVPFIENKIKVGGSFKRPYIYEFVEGETLQDAVNLAGGYKSGTILSPNIELSRLNQDNQDRELILVEISNIGSSGMGLRDGDSINISEYSGLEAKTIELKGEFESPGVYSIMKGDTILDIIERAGGYTESAFTEGAVFLRKEVSEQQKAAFMRTADSLERNLVNMLSNGTFGSIGEFTLSPLVRLIERLRNEEPIGRQVVEVGYLALKSDPFANFKLRDRDFLFVPERPGSITVSGEVLNATTLRYDPNLSVEDYISLSGGFNDEADKNSVFAIQPNGNAMVVKQRLFGKSANILPGTTIVVPRNSRYLDAISWTGVITPVLADLATSAAAIAAISRD
jgi:protein involved in polysaccharide export with SLBB domain